MARSRAHLANAALFLVLVASAVMRRGGGSWPAIPFFIGLGNVAICYGIAWISECYPSLINVPDQEKYDVLLPVWVLLLAPICADAQDVDRCAPSPRAPMR